MSDSHSRDRGLTLVELVVVISVIGLVMTALSAAIVVTLRQAPAANARIEHARWEQNLGTWIPADLTSAHIPPLGEPGYYDPTDPNFRPGGCPDSMCGTGTDNVNVLHLEWVEGAVNVVVSYRYRPSSDGSKELVRVECRDGSCSEFRLIGELSDVNGQPPFAAVTPPEITYLDPNGTGSQVSNTSGRSVAITITSEAGTTTMNFSGGGTELVDLIPGAIQPPQFLVARSGCGGPITLIVDESTSLSSSDINNVRAGVRSFVQTFAGTPTQLQIIAMAGSAEVIAPSSAGNPWNYWFDLSETSVVNSLLATGSGSSLNQISPRSATNWEDAFYHAYYASNGQTYQYNGNPAAPAAELIVFFTDGLPTYDRDDDQWGPETPEGPNPPSNSAFDGIWDGDEITQFNPTAWIRAQWILQQNPTIPVIGVGVGQAFGESADLYRDTTLSNSEIDLWAATRVGSGSSSRKWIPAELLLGDLIAGNNPTTWTTGTPMSTRFKEVAWSASQPANGGWGDISQADILTTTDFTKFGSALEQIALGQCGGTLSVQTRLNGSGTPITESVTYETTGPDHPMSESTTSAVNKTAVFDIVTEGATEQVSLRPRPMDATGYAPQRWECRSRNVVVNNPSKVSLITPGNPAAGINVTVAANEALSCVLFVVPA